MSASAADEPLSHAVTVPGPPERAFVPDRVPVPNPAKAGEVEVRFLAEGGSGTRVELEHRGFARHGDGGARYREAMGSAPGWPLILDRFAASLS